MNLQAENKPSPFLSQKFRFWSFVSMLLLVFVHGYNLNDRYMEPWTIPGEPLTPTSFTQYFLANGIFRFRIPMLFMISGFLFALKDNQPHTQRMKGRIRTLLAPYLIWSAVGLLMVLVLERFAATKEWILSSHMMQISETTMLLHDYKWYEVLLRWIFFPVCYQLWFIRVLLIYNLAYKGIRWCVTHWVAKRIYFPIVFLLWLATFGTPLIEGEGLFFFSLGIWMQKQKFDVEKPRRWMSLALWLPIFFITAAIKTILAFQGNPAVFDSTHMAITAMHKLTVVSGLITAWYGGDFIVRWAMKRNWFVWLSAFSFMIYAMHAPLVALLIDPFFNLLHHMEGYRIISFILLPLLLITAAVGFGALLRWLSPAAYQLLTGGRGLGYENSASLTTGNLQPQTVILKAKTTKANAQER